MEANVVIFGCGQDMWSNFVNGGNAISGTERGRGMGPQLLHRTHRVEFAYAV